MNSISSDLTDPDLVAEEEILAYLRHYPGKALPLWDVVNVVSGHYSNRPFYRRVISRLIRERKIIRYRKSFRSEGIRVHEIDRIRISEAYV